MAQQISESAKKLKEMFAISPHNQIVLPGMGSIKDVKIFDTTLRDGEQAPDIALGPDDKVCIAQALDIDIIKGEFAVSNDIERNTTYEPFLFEVVGVRRRLVVGKLPGPHLVKEKITEIGINFPQEHMDEFTQPEEVIS